MTSQFEIETTVKGGLPVIVEVEVEAPEPDTGHPTRWVSSYQFRWRNGKPMSAKMMATIPQRDIEAALEHALDTQERFTDEDVFRF